MQRGIAFGFVFGCLVGFSSCNASLVGLEQHAAIITMAPMDVAPWMLDLSDRIRKQLVLILSEADLSVFDSAMGLLLENRVDKKVFNFLKKTRNSVRKSARLFAQQMRKTRNMSLKNMSADKKVARLGQQAIRADYTASVKEYTARVAGVLEDLVILEREMVKAFFWFKQRRDKYLENGFNPNLEGVKKYSTGKKSFTRDEYEKIFVAADTVDMLLRAHRRAQLALLAERKL